MKPSMAGYIQHWIINIGHHMFYMIPFRPSSLCFVEPWVCGRAVLPAELPGSGAAELPISKPIPLQPRRCDGDMLHPPKQEAPHPFTECQCPSTHAAFDAHTHTPTRLARAQHHSHSATQHQVCLSVRSMLLLCHKEMTFLTKGFFFCSTVALIHWKHLSCLWCLCLGHCIFIICNSWNFIDCDTWQESANLLCDSS